MIAASMIGILELGGANPHGDYQNDAKSLFGADIDELRKILQDIDRRKKRFKNTNEAMQGN